MIIKVISPLWKRGVRGDFIPFKSPFIPLFLRGMIIKVISPLWKRGARGDFFLLNPPLSPFF
ncbi:MAG: hypothetical protein KA120_09765 [Candidatus Goldbacteria bacterium]|nr:hypothetical protein [Candidatus Goldiibacteriota bacterium]